MGILAALGGPRDIGLGTRWTPLVQAHGHLQLMGWVGLFLAGVAFYVLPRFKQTDLRYPHLARPAIGLIAAGLAVRTVSQPYSDHGWVAGLMVASAVVEMAGVACFAAVVAGTLLASRRKNYDWYLLAACGWLAASAAANLVVVAEIARDGQSVIASAKDGPLLTMQLYGFIALFIFGVSIRILPHFLSLRPPSVRWFVPALVLYNAGLLIRVRLRLGAPLTAVGRSRTNWKPWASTPWPPVSLPLRWPSSSISRRGAMRKAKPSAGTSR